MNRLYLQSVQSMNTSLSRTLYRHGGTISGPVMTKLLENDYAQLFFEIVTEHNSLYDHKLSFLHFCLCMDKTNEGICSFERFLEVLVGTFSDFGQSKASCCPISSINIKLGYSPPDSSCTVAPLRVTEVHGLQFVALQRAVGCRGCAPRGIFLFIDLVASVMYSRHVVIENVACALLNIPVDHPQWLLPQTWKWFQSSYLTLGVKRQVRIISPKC